MKPDHDLIWLTLGAVLLFGAAAVYSGTVLAFVGKTRGLKSPPRFAVTIFRIWFSLLAGGALWLLVSSLHGQFARAGGL
jgi:hypothetical protein